MKMGKHFGRLVALVSAILLAACASEPKQKPDFVFEPGDSMPSLIPGEQRFLERAEILTRQESWYEAAQQWEILQLMHPDVPEYAQRLQANRARAKQAVADQLEAAEQASKRAKPDQAMLAYLKALRMDPVNQSALEGLRHIESERATLAYLNKARVNGVAKRYKATTTNKNPVAAYGGTRQVLDAGILLFRQGNYAASIQQLEDYLRSDPQDESGRGYLIQAYQQLSQQLLRAGKQEDALAGMEKALNLKGRSDPELAESIKSLRMVLADSYYDKAVRIYYSDLGKAIEFLERALQLNPNHKLSLLRLRQANKAQKNLKALNGASAP